MSYYNVFSPQKSPNLGSKRHWRFHISFNWKKIGKIAGIIFAAGFLFVAGVFIYFAKDLPSPGKINTRFIAESTKIYDRTGQHILYDIHGEEKRTLIPLNEIPDSIKYATIVLEDQDFYSHAGIKFSSIVRAFLKDVLRRGVTQGGSTITQQFIKNSVLSPERTLTRKIKEVILSLELEQKFSKDEILGMYLNEIPYGSNAYGIEAAAQTFFGKHARELSLDEAALLASLPQAPTFYSPFGSRPEELKRRQEFTLNKLASLGYITEAEAQEAISVDVLSKISPQQENISAPHFVMYVKEYLEKNYGQALIEKGGLKVYTTLDWDKQQIAEQAVREGAEKNTKSYNASNASLVAMDPKNGQILAMVGSKDYFDKTIDGQVNVAIRERQPGSSFKPYVYLTAFEKGYTPETILWDVDTEFETGTNKTYNPKNYDGKNRGPLKMKEALGMSLNVPAVKTLYLAGIKNSLDTAKSLGITSLTDPSRVGLSLVLGGGEIKLLDHVNAFATLATGGIYREKTAILKIQDASGSVLEEFKANSGERVVEEKYVAMLDYILSTNDLRKPIFGANSPLRFDERPVVAKTGTTNEWRDGWAVGYTPSLAVGVWAGNNDNSPMSQGADGVFTAAPIFRKFMDQTFKNYTIEQFPKYEPEETGKPILDGTLEMNEKIQVCKISKDKYCLATDACPESTREEKKFFTGHDTLWYVKKDDPRGDAPKNPEDDPQFKNWEKAVRKWVKKDKNYSSADAPENKCEVGDFEDYLPSVKITSPDDGETITGASFTIKASLKAGFGLQKATLYINGDSKDTTTSSDFNYEYAVPDSLKNAELGIKIEILDKNGNSTSSVIKVTTNIL
jgi:1A family penicillin-binding protein